MTIYVTIKFKMTKGYEPPILYAEQNGQFHDVVRSIIKQYNAKKDNVESEMSSLITLSDKELVEYAKIYAKKVKFEPIAFLIQSDDQNWIERKEKTPFDYYKNGEFSIEDSQIVGYNCDKAQAFMPRYNLYEKWTRQDFLQDETNIKKNLPIFKRYIQRTLEGKMFLGIEISKIESVTLELC